MSKGSKRREEDAEKVRENWDKVFAPKPEKQEEPVKRIGNNGRGWCGSPYCPVCNGI